MQLTLYMFTWSLSALTVLLSSVSNTKVRTSWAMHASLYVTWSTQGLRLGLHLEQCCALWLVKAFVAWQIDATFSSPEFSFCADRVVSSAALLTYDTFQPNSWKCLQFARRLPHTVLNITTIFRAIFSYWQEFAFGASRVGRGESWGKSINLFHVISKSSGRLKEKETKKL